MELCLLRISCACWEIVAEEPVWTQRFHVRARGMRQPASSTTGCSPPPTSTSNRCSPTSHRQLQAAAGRSRHHPLASANACATAVLRAPRPASNAVPHARSPCAAYTPCCARSLLDASRAFRLLASLHAPSLLRHSSYYISTPS